MLYNILSPVIFILSLGGIIVVVSRVAVRMRREEFASDIKTFAAAAGPARPGLSGSVINDASEVLRPTQKSVQAIKSRLGLFKVAVQQSQSVATGLLHAAQSKQRQVFKKVPAVAGRGIAGGQAALSRFKKPNPIRWLKEKREGKRLAAIHNQATVETKPSPAIAYSAMSAAKASEVKEESQSSAIKRKIRLVRKRIESLPVKEEKRPEARVVSKPVGSEAAKTDIRNTTPRKLWPYSSSVIAPAIKEAEAALQLENYQQAEDILVAHIMEHTKDTDAYTLLGQTAIKKGAWGEALEIFEQVVKWNAQQPGAYMGLGIAAYHAGRLTRALEAFKKARESDPADEAVLEHIFSIAQKMDNVPLQNSIQHELEELRRIDQKEPALVRGGIRLK